MAKIDFGGVLEDVVTRDEFPLSRAQEVLKKEVVAVLGYGVQGPAQALNMRDNGINVIIGQKENLPEWEKAIKDGWIPGETLSPSKKPPNAAPSFSFSSLTRHKK
jgi:ketol-acid reductoisomerase